MVDPSQPWRRHAAGSPLRPYQVRAVGEILEHLQRPGARICLVAPPGAGKTRCALHVASELALPLEVRVPTTALQGQWEQRAGEQIVDVTDAAEGSPVNVSTYAGLGSFQPGALVVLDEAHHLQSAWGRKVEAELGPEHRVLGLTGTPPVGGAGWDRFVQIVGDDPVEVAAPPLVRDGHLCPFLDLVWPVLADLEDVPALRDADQVLTEAEAALGDDLQQWMARTLREDLWELTEARFARNEGLLVALCRVRHAQGRALPHDLPPDAELRARPTLHDRVQALWAYGSDRDDVRAAVRAAGFRRAGKVVTLRNDVALQSLAASRTRVRGMLDVLALEARARTDWLRALVLTDRDVEGSRLSAREVLGELVADARTDVLDPVLVTGSVFWVDDDLWPRVGPRVPDLPFRRVRGHREVDVASWPTARRVELATRLLTEGVTRCLVGTHHLLGEGWDCPAVNCVVDLTGISASMTVNQVRGRALRPDPADPGKVASLWEVLPLAPGIGGGDRMLDVLKTRHAHTLGIDPEGRIRAGVSRIHPAFAGPASEVAAQVPGIREQMTRRLVEMKGAAAHWAVGRAYADRRVWQVRGSSPTPPVRLRGERPKAPIRATAAALHHRKRRRGMAAGIAALAGISAGLLGMITAGPILGIPVAATGMLVSSLLVWTGLRDWDLVAVVVRALFDALRTANLAEGELRSRAGLWWLEGTPDHSRVFAGACAELLGPIRYPRYLLVETSGRVWPVPAVLGGDRNAAQILAHAWAAHVGPCEVVYARQGRGRELLTRTWRAAGRAPVDVVEIWE